MNPLPIVGVAANKIRAWDQWRRRVKVLVHRAVFLPTSPEQYFVKVVNMSKRREIEITHIWIETTPAIHLGNPRVH